MALLGACTPQLAPEVDDARACPGSNVELTQVLDHFALQLPPSATDVRFYSEVHPTFGEYFVELRFSAPPAEVSSFLAAGDGSRQEGRNSDLTPPDECLGLGSFAPSSVVADYGPSSSLREFAVDDRDATAPVVYFSAMDHP